MPQRVEDQASGDFMHNVLRNLGRCSAAPQDTTNYDSDMIDTCVFLPRGMELSNLLDIDPSTVNMDTAATNEVENMSIRGASFGGSPDGNITHQYAAKLSLEEYDLYQRRIDEMNKWTITSTKLKTATTPLKKGRAVIYKAAL